MRLVVVANGTWDTAWGREALRSADLVICADGGGNAAIASGRLPDVLIGDMDSITRENLAHCKASGVEIIDYPKEKDETDLELALHYACRKVQAGDAEEIILYGALGDRIDHVLGNIALMLFYAQQGIKIRARDDKQELWIISGREEIRGRAGQELSLVILSSQAVVSTEGLYYPLHQSLLKQTTPRGISNVLTGEKAVVQVDEGWVMAVLLEP